MKNRRLLLAVAAAALLYTGAARVPRPHERAMHEHAMKVGKTGEVTFDKETTIGDMTLKPGRYKFNHRVEGSDHFVHFTEWARPIPNAGITAPNAPKGHPGEVKCAIEPLTKKVSQTTIYTTDEGNGARVTKVEVAGENVAHLF